MDWMKAIGEAIEYIEDNITDDITPYDIASHVNISPFYFQKGFSLLCGYSLSEYIRFRRLSLAAHDLIASDERIIDIALKYGYDSPDSFTKAFTRFHGVTPLSARKSCVSLRSFAPLKIKISLSGGYLMTYKIEKKDSFKVIGKKGTFSYEKAKEVIPLFWKEVFEDSKNTISGQYGMNIDKTMGGEQFEYIIADPYRNQELQDGLVIETIPSFEWAVFPCVGALPYALQDVNKKIFSEWLPALKDYDFAAGYCIEYYSDPKSYKNGTMDENYYSEIWIPVKKR